MAEDIGKGPFGFGSWTYDCARLVSTVTPPPIDPITREVPNTLGVRIGLGGSLIAWVVRRVGGLFGAGGDQQTATQKINEKLQSEAAFKGFARVHLWAQGYSVPCDPATKKRKVGWHWFATVTLIASADLAVGEAEGFITVLLGPFTGAEKDCACPEPGVSMVPGHDQLHLAGAALVAVRVQEPGAVLSVDGVGSPPILAISSAGEVVAAEALYARPAPTADRPPEAPPAVAVAHMDAPEEHKHAHPQDASLKLALADLRASLDRVEGALKAGGGS